jgi:hypothetical protein
MGHHYAFDQVFKIGVEMAGIQGEAGKPDPLSGRSRKSVVRGRQDIQKSAGARYYLALWDADGISIHSVRILPAGVLF